MSVLVLLFFSGSHACVKNILYMYISVYVQPYFLWWGVYPLIVSNAEVHVHVRTCIHDLAVAVYISPMMNRCTLSPFDMASLSVLQDPSLHQACFLLPAPSRECHHLVYT